MVQDEQTAVRQSAIQKLIRAKSDREIARLLRKSHRLLNLHRRRRSCVSHRERWSDYELRLLGRIRDEELAKLLQRTPAAVAARRESLDIPIFAPQRIRWSRREIELLGKRPDGVVARMLGRTRYAVQLKRYSLGIAQCWENRRAWTPSEDALLGRMRDAELAAKLKRSVLSVRSRRNDKTTIRFIRTPRRWTPSELRLFGRLPDAEIARRSGRFPATVCKKRIQLGIAPFRPKHIGTPCAARAKHKPRVLVSPQAISARTLKMLEKSAANLKKGLVSAPIGLSGFRRRSKTRKKRVELPT